MKKWILRGVLGLVGLILLVVIILFFSLNMLVKAGVVRGGTYATDQVTTLDLADLSLSGGKVQLDGLGISNPNGYTAPQFVVMKQCAVTVQTSTVFSGTVVVDSIIIDGLELTLEQNGLKNNLAEILDIVQKKTAAAAGTSGAPPANGSSSPSPGKKLTINVIKLTNTKVHVKGIASMDLNLGDLEIKDPTNPDGRPMKIADVIGKILLSVGKQVLENPQIPSEIKDGLKNVSKIVNDLGAKLGNVTNLGNLKDVGKDVGKDLKDVGKNLQDMGKGLGGLLKPNTSQPK